LILAKYNFVKPLSAEAFFVTLLNEKTNITYNFAFILLTGIDGTGNKSAHV
jgi:hypothetical protein